MTPTTHAGSRWPPLHMQGVGGARWGLLHMQGVGGARWPPLHVQGVGGARWLHYTCRVWVRLGGDFYTCRG